MSDDPSASASDIRCTATSPSASPPRAATGGWLLGWIAALAAVLTAYVRLLGGSLRLAQDFCGPMAKAQRMALLTVACLGSAVEAAVGPPRGYVIAAALALIAVGSLATCGRRLRRMAAAISSR